MRLKYIEQFRDRHGNMRRYFRRSKNESRVALPGEPGSAKFMQAYMEALEGFAPVNRQPLGASLIKKNTGCIYFLDDGAFIKIGFSTNLARRMKEYDTHRSSGPKVVAVLRDVRPDDDQQLRRRFAGLRARGDWFRKGPSLVAFVEKIKNGSVSKTSLHLDNRRKSPTISRVNSAGGAP